MESHRVNKLKARLNEIESQVDQKKVKHLELEKLERIINRLDEFSPKCETCAQHFSELEAHLAQLFDQKEKIDKQVIKEHTKFINQLEGHLFDQHDLKSEGYYTGIYMSLGISVGLLLGLVVFDQIALGLPIGLVIGVGVGSAKDQAAKKKGKTI